MAVRIKNADTVERFWLGQGVAASAYYTIDPTELTLWKNDSALLVDIANGMAIVNDGTTDFTNVNTGINYLKGTGPQEVVTLLEKSDKGLRLASAESTFTGNDCVIDVPIPGTLGTIGRYAAGGYGFTDIYGFGDRVTDVSLVDITFVYAGILYPATPIEAGIPGTEGLSWADVMPTGVVLGSFHDDDVDPSMKGWRLWCDDGNQGGIDIDPLGGYGEMLAQTVLRIIFLKTGSSGATKAAVNLWWGKQAT